MKLVVLSLAYNEEKNIEKTILSIPRQIPNIDEVKILVINDGSTDKTYELALNAGADKIVSHKTNMGVGAAFMTGIRNAISMDADLLVTLDGDGESSSEEIPVLINPIINNQFDVVVGIRFIKNIPSNYPRLRLFGNKIFSKIVSFVAGKKFADTQTGFRAYSKDALEDISVVNDFTYTQEVLLDLHFKKFRIGDVPVTDSYRGESRAVKSVFRYTCNSLAIIIRSLVFHRPMMVFGLFGLFLSVIGITAKIIYGHFPHIASVHPTLSSGLILLGAVSFMMGLFASIVFKRQVFAERDLRHHLQRLRDSEK